MPRWLIGMEERRAALALAAPLCWASGSVFTRHVKLPIRPLVAAAMEMLWAGLLFGIASILTGTQPKLESHLKRLLPPEIVAQLSQCVSTNPRHRPTSTAAFAHLLRNLSR